LMRHHQWKFGYGSGCPLNKDSNFEQPERGLVQPL
jgi:hypothetical protein